MSSNYVQKKLCSQPKVAEQVFSPGISPDRMKFIISTNKKWVNGTEIRYMFMEGAENQRGIVRQAFQQWKDLGIGISFKEVKAIEESMVRIGFNWNDGSWSYVGRDVLTISKPDLTMNFGWDLAANSYGMTTALHEIGHTIGFQHEHQSPFTGISWNADAVYKEFSGSPNFWKKSDIDFNILNKISPNQVKGSNWDPASIMEYEFGPGLIAKPEEFKNGIFPPGVLSYADIAGVKTFYPEKNEVALSALQVMKSAVINARPGEQADFIFTAPITKKYTFQTFGEMDTVMVVSEKGKKENYYLSGDDDSGQEKNSTIKLPLVKGRDYLVNVRVMFNSDVNSGGILVF